MSSPVPVRTPLEPFPRLGEAVGLELWVKRDDLYPSPGGGNKARKIVRILEDAEGAGSDALVTTGGIGSNHARVTALEAARRGWACRLVLHGDADSLRRPMGNLLLMILSGARIEIVEPTGIGPAMEAAVAALRAKGHRPFEIPGGGHCLAGARAYQAAGVELDRQCREVGFDPEIVLLASGTGTTQAGIVAGLAEAGRPARVVGISVARRNPRGRAFVLAAYRELTGAPGPDQDETAGPEPRPMEFRDEWVGEGYGKASARVHAAIRRAAAHGLILDPIYTGKAFHALEEMVDAGEIERGTRVLFWHTGGLLNLMAESAFATGDDGQ
jgi:1-aminocyclopropane-1-carboxylate deaminase/D-cysteine desulfhydrase-like pyridoxal-dependent ACC family enzyme